MDNQLKKILIDVIIFFDKKANELIKLLADKYNLDLTDENPFSKLLTRSNNLWKGEIKEGWTYRFHGGSCEFHNVLTGQILDAHINKNKQFGALDDFFLHRFIETTKELEYVRNRLHSKDDFWTGIKELEHSNIIIDIGEEYFPIRVLNYDLISKDN